MRRLNQSVGICVIIAILLCVGGSRDSGDSAWFGWPFTWVQGSSAKTGKSILARLSGSHPAPLLLVADIGIGFLIGSGVGAAIGLLLRWRQRWQAGAPQL